MLNVKSYKDAAYEVIKEKIISGEYKPGISLNERAISEEFGISRTPVREALHQLSYEGWIINEPYKKNVVKEFDLNSIIEAQRVRASLEILATVEASKTMDKEDIEYLEELINEQENTDNYSEFIALDRKFHEYIYLKSKNKMLQNLMENINDIVRYFGLIAIESPGRISSTIAEHKNLIEAMKSEDEDKIISTAREHMVNTEESIKKRYNDKNIENE